MIEVRRRGVPSAVICSAPFRKLGETQARVLGIPDLPLIMIKHPLGGITLDNVKERADAALPQVLELLLERAS